MLQYFIGIVPPKNIYEKITQLRQEWGYSATEPHITIKSSGGLNDIKNWMSKVSEIVSDYKAFDISVKGIDYFGDSVLFYKILSEEILNLHKQIVKAVYPTDQEIKDGFELDHYIPHLTIMKHKRGYKHLPLHQIELNAKEILNNEYVFKSHFVRVFGRHNEGKNYVKIIDIPFRSK